MSLHSNRSSISRRPVGGQASTVQPSSPTQSNVSRSTSVSSGAINYEIYIGPDIPFRPAQPLSTPSEVNKSAVIVEQDRTLSEILPTPQAVEQSPIIVPLPNNGPGTDDFFFDAPSAPLARERSIEVAHAGISTLEVVPEGPWNGFWSPEPVTAPASEPAMIPEPHFESNVTSTGPPTALPQHYPDEPPISYYQPPFEEFSPLSTPAIMPVAMPPPLFSTVTPTTSPMMPSTVAGVEPTPPPTLSANVPSRMPSNAKPPILHVNQPRSVDQVSFASVCCECSNAVLYNTYYYNCTYCKLDICGTCFQAGEHPWTHLPSLIRLNAQETKAGDKRQDKQCQSCKSMKHRRMDCDECPYSICLSCHSNDKVPSHQHKSFKLKATPGLTLSVRRGDGSPCCAKPSFGHCGRCYAPWKPEEWMVQCKTCLFEFEEVVATCLQCDSEIFSACRQNQHQMVSMKCRQKLRSEGQVPGQQNQASVECTECAWQFPSMTDIAFLRHPHINYDYLFFTEDRELLFAAVYRSCKKKAKRVDTPLAPTATTTKCSYCNHNVPNNIIQSCLPCHNIKYCPHCYPIASSTHHHGPSSFISLCDLTQAQLGGGWTQRKNSAGRIWYHHTSINAQSFEFPKSTISQEAAPTSAVVPASAKPLNPRRATTGGIPSKPIGPLPPGWEARKTPDGRRYYANHSTKQTSWQRPASVARPVRPNAGKQRTSSVPSGGIQWEQDAAQVVKLTPEQKLAAKLEAKKKAENKRLMVKLGTSVLKGVVSGVISS